MKRIFLAIFIIQSVISNAHIRDTLEGASKWRFIENKNQWDNNILFKTQAHGGVLFLEKNLFTVVLEDVEVKNRLLAYKNSPEIRARINLNDSIIKYHAYKMQFVNSNSNVLIKPENSFPDYENYFIGNDSKKWASNVLSYQTVVYNNLYNGINLTVYSKDYHLKYDFVVSPNSDPNQISIKYEGVNGLNISKGNLIIKTSLYNIVELKPYAYQIINNKEIPVGCDYKIFGDEVKFILGKYDDSKELVIDPTLIFSSYSGSTADNWGFTATYDKLGNLYSGGIAFGIGYPTSVGAYQLNYIGGVDISISKFNTTGSNLIYSTYLGGLGNEVPHSLIVNENNELYVLGTTGSSNFPTTIGCYDATFNGGISCTNSNSISYSNGSDIILTKFSENGQSLVGSTYFGGTGNDGLNLAIPLRKNYADEVRGEIMIDAQSNVYVVSSTSSQDLPISTTAFQTINNGGGQDGCIIKLNQNLTNLIWASYLGGSGSDACYSIDLDENNNIFVSGGTSSTNFPTTAGALRTTYQGGISDGFISRINENGTSIITSSYFGSSVYDQVYLCKRDRNNNIYLYGQTSAPDYTFIQNALYNMPNGGQFLTKLNSNLSTIVWSTTFGTGNGGPDISPTALLVDYCNNIYMSGWGGFSINNFGGTNGLPTTSNAFQSTTDGRDFYFIVINDVASQLVYASFFGGTTSGEHVDGGTSRFDKKGKIYQAVCAGCGGYDDFPTTPGVWSNTNNSRNCNMGVIKLDFNLPSVVADFIAPNTVCAPATINFQNTSQVIGTGVNTIWHWDFGDGGTSILQSPNHTFSVSGIYNITLVVSDIGSCNFSDTIKKQIIVLSNTKDTLEEKSVCLGDFTQIGVPPSGNPAITYNWQPLTGLSNPLISNPIAQPNITTTYILKISDGVCVDTLVQKVNVNAISVNACSDFTICRGDTANLTATFSGSANHFIWSNDINFTTILNSNTSIPTYRPIANSSNKFYIRASKGDCYGIDSVQVTVSFSDITTTTPVHICYGDTAQISAINLIPSQNISYVWSPVTSIVSGANTSNPFVNPLVNTNFTVVASNSLGCKDSANVFVFVDRVITEATVTNVSCYGLCTGSISLTPSGGVAPYSYSWSHSATAHNSFANSLCIGNYTAIITDDNGCKLTFNQAITEPLPIQISFTDTIHVLCNGICNGQVRAIVTGGTSPFQYNWINGQTTDLAINLCAGLYSITITDANLCSATSSTRVHDTSAFIASSENINVRCFDECNGQSAIISTNGNLPITYLWNFGSTNDTAFNLCAGVYSARVTEAHGCIQNVFAQIIEPDKINIDSIIKVMPLCNGSSNGTISLYVRGGRQPYTYNWNGVSGLSYRNDLSAGNYIISIIDSSGCELDTTISLSQPEMLQMQITSSKVPCAEVCNATATVIASGGTPTYQFVWSNTQQGDTATNLCIGNNSIMVTDSHNCVANKNFIVEDTSYFSASFNAWSDKDTIYRSQSVQLHVTNINGFTYNWSPTSNMNNSTSTDPIVKPLNTTDYIVYIHDIFGCEKTDTVRIVVLDVVCEEPFIFVPNAFSPNNDLKNDVFNVRSEILLDIYFAIYNRWGEKVFETTELNNGWDGTFKGQKCESAVFVYYIDATCINNMKYIKKGNITLIK